MSFYFGGIHGRRFLFFRRGFPGENHVPLDRLTAWRPATLEQNNILAFTFFLFLFFVDSVFLFPSQAVFSFCLPLLFFGHFSLLTAQMVFVAFNCTDADTKKSHLNNTLNLVKQDMAELVNWILRNRKATNINYAFLYIVWPYLN